jgi:hypothetical protein
MFALSIITLSLVIQHFNMIELTAEIPFLWRLGAESSEGYCSVSMIVPCPPETEIKDLTIETSVLSLSSDSIRSEKEETLEWNQEDISLFLKLVNQKQLANKQRISDTVRIDLTDPAIIDIIHIVAAAGFGVAFTSYGLLKESNGLYPVHSCEIGSLASLNTTDEYERLSIHDLLLAKRGDILHPEFAETKAKPETTVLH